MPRRYPWLDLHSASQVSWDLYLRHGLLLARFRDHLGKEVPFVRMDPRVLRDTRLSRNARLCYALLQTFASTEGEAWPAIPTLSSIMGHATSPNKAAAYINELEAAGYLWKESRPGKSTVYHLSTPPANGLGQDSEPHPLMGGTPPANGSTTPPAGGLRTRSSELDPRTRAVETERWDPPPEGFSLERILKAIPKAGHE